MPVTQKSNSDYASLPTLTQITIITKIEVLRGRHEYLLKAATGPDILKAQQLLLRTEALLNRLPALLINEAVTFHFERLRKTRGLRRAGRADLLIASVALSRQAILVTRNIRHFRSIPGLIVTNWVD